MPRRAAGLQMSVRPSRRPEGECVSAIAEVADILLAEYQRQRGESFLSAYARGRCGGDAGQDAHPKQLQETGAARE